MMALPLQKPVYTRGHIFATGIKEITIGTEQSPACLTGGIGIGVSCGRWIETYELTISHSDGRPAVPDRLE